MRSTLVLGAAVILCAASMLPASVVLSERDDLVSASAQAQRYPPLGSDPLSSNDVYSAFDSFTGLLPTPHTVTTSGSGSMNDTATNLALVASGAGSANATSSLSYDGASNLNLYAVTGSYNSTIHSAALNGYLPNNIDPNTDPYLAGGAVYNSSISFLVSDLPASFTIQLSQSNSVGMNVYNAEVLYRDNNNNLNLDGGDDVIENSLLVIGNGTQSVSGVLQPSASPYRLLFYGNSYDGTFEDNTTQMSSTNYTSTFTIAVPEPGSIAGLAFLALPLVCRRRQ